MNYDRPGYLLYQTLHQKPLTVAYISRDDPRTLTERVPILQHFRHLGDDILAVNVTDIGQTVLHDLGIAWLVVDRYKMPDGLERSYTSTLVDAIMAGQLPFYEDDRVTVYAVTGENPKLPYVRLGQTGWGSLQTEKAGQRSRAIGPTGAGLEFVHPASQATLEIEYRSDKAISIDQRGTSPEKIMTLPPAPKGAILKLPLTATTMQAGIEFHSRGEAHIQALRLHETP